jgi:hypothetical protein
VERRTSTTRWPSPPDPLRRAALPAALVAGGAAFGGIPGFLAAFAGALIGVDRLLDRMPGFGGSALADAERRFDQLARERRRHPSQLRHLPEEAGVTGRLLGVEPIPLGSIVGTVDRHKAEAFDAEFRPPHYSRGRWSQMLHAVDQGAELPPISVYRRGGEHYVRDGHHRVSVARARGAADIDAEVTEISASR